jgi:hypothetical protein
MDAYDAHDHEPGSPELKATRAGLLELLLDYTNLYEDRRSVRVA